jgi:hypothetical protein
VALILVTAGATVAATRLGGRAGQGTIALAAARTLAVHTKHFAAEVEVAKNGLPFVLHISGASAPDTVAVQVRLDAKQPDGSAEPVASGAAVRDGPFLYERGPGGGSSWLRVQIATLQPGSPALQSLNDMTPEPLLRLLGKARAGLAKLPPGVFRGTLAYDDPTVVNALQGITAGTQYRSLRIAAWVGKDRLVHRIRLTGRTADGRTSLRIDARIFSFGRPVKVTPPKQGTFVDPQIARLAA